ncbi:flavin reductase family protein, partial [Bittarella massiliensis (ex Durand et al. 2017)]
CGVRSGRDGDKFAAAGLTRAPASKIATPLVTESPVNLECRVTQVLELGSHHMFLAEIVAVDVEESLLDGSGKHCLDRAELIHYTHGEYFAQGEKL